MEYVGIELCIGIQYGGWETASKRHGPTIDHLIPTLFYTTPNDVCLPWMYHGYLNLPIFKAVAINSVSPATSWQSYPYQVEDQQDTPAMACAKMTSQRKDLPTMIHCIDNNKTKMLCHFQLWEICSFFSFFGPLAANGGNVEWRRTDCSHSLPMQSWWATEKAKGDHVLCIQPFWSNSLVKTMINSSTSIFHWKTTQHIFAAVSMFFFLLRSHKKCCKISALVGFNWWSQIDPNILIRNVPVHRRWAYQGFCSFVTPLCSFVACWSFPPNKKTSKNHQRYKQWCNETQRNYS